MIDRADAMSIKNGTAVNVCVFKISDYYQTDLFARIKQIEYPEILVHEVSLSQVTLSRASYRMYGFDYPRGTLSVNFHPTVSAEDITTISTGGMIAARQVLDNRAKVSLLDGSQRLEKMRQQHVKGDPGWIE